MSRALSCFVAGLGGVFAGLLADPAAAADVPGGTLSISAGAATDYVVRGRSQTGGDIGVNGRLDYEHSSGLFVGTQAANADLGGAEAHLRFYGGHTGDIGTLFYVLTGEYNAYPDSGLDLGYGEVKGTLGIDYGVALLRAGAAYSPDYFADSGDSVYVFSNADVYLPLGWPVTVAVGGEFGYQTIQDRTAFGAGDHATWNLGVTVTYKRFDFDLRYHDATIPAAGFGQPSDARLVAGISVFF